MYQYIKEQTKEYFEQEIKKDFKQNTGIWLWLFGPVPEPELDWRFSALEKGEKFFRVYKGVPLRLAIQEAKNVADSINNIVHLQYCFYHEIKPNVPYGQLVEEIKESLDNWANAFSF